VALPPPPNDVDEKVKDDDTLPPPKPALAKAPPKLAFQNKSVSIF